MGHWPVLRLNSMLPLIKDNISLAGYTTYKIGGSADFFCEVITSQALEEAVLWAKSRNLPISILGGGSNLLISDDGWRGLILKISNITYEETGNTLLVGAGLSLMELVWAAARHGLSGLEWAAGIPGTVGGAVRGNAGAYGGEMKDNVSRVLAYNLASGEWRWFTPAELDWAYRSSCFKQDRLWVLWQIELQLQIGAVVAVTAATHVILAKRVGLPKEPSAGCVFKNLIWSSLSVDQQQALVALSQEINHDKLAAGRLIDSLDLKGQQVGEAAVSLEHANFIVNRGGATANDVLTLIKEVKNAVQQKYNLPLATEIELVGFKPENLD